MTARNLIILSHPTYVGASGATAAATYAFFTKEYKPPAQSRSLDVDIVHNQNGKFKYLYDNGPGFKQWSPFTVMCHDTFQSELGVAATAQYSRIREMWEYPGALGMRAPEGTYGVHWSSSPMEQAFRAFPIYVTDTPEWDVVVQFEEAT